MNNNALHPALWQSIPPRESLPTDQRYISHHYGSIQTNEDAYNDKQSVTVSETTPTNNNNTQTQDHGGKYPHKVSPTLETSKENDSCSLAPKVPYIDQTQELSYRIEHYGTETSAEFSLVTQSRILTQVVSMLYFSSVFCTNSLLPQYMVHRLTMDAHGSMNASQVVTSIGPCNMSNSSGTARADDIQSKASQQVLYFTLSASIPSLLTCLIAGVYSDIIGRRPLLLVGCFTGSLKMLLISIIIKLELPTWLFYIAYTIDGLSGSWTIMFVMFVSSIADTNPEKKDRVFWVAVLGCTMSMVGAFLLVMTGILIDQLGFFAATMMCVASSSSAYLLAFFSFPETLPPSDKRKLKVFDGVRKIASYFFHGGSVTERLRLWTCLFIFMLTIITPLCLVTIDTLYLLHRPFCWTHSAIGLYNGGRMAITFLIGTIILRTCQSCCKPEILAMVGLMLQTVGFLLEAESSQFWHMLLVPVVSCPGTNSIPVIRAILSSLGSSADQGAINSSVAVVEVIINLIGNVGVLSIYSATLAGPLPGAVYLFLASCGVGAFFLYLVYFLLRVPERKDYEQIVN